MTNRQPCTHYFALSSSTGLDCDGVCLTCGAEWSTEDMHQARQAYTLCTTCLNCSASVRLRPEQVTCDKGTNGGVWSFDCPTCTVTNYRPLTDAHYFAFVAVGVQFTTPGGLTDREVRDFLTDLGSDYLAAIAQREMTR